MLWQPCEVEWPDAPQCERQGIMLLQLGDGDQVLACIECARNYQIERMGLVLR